MVLYGSKVKCELRMMGTAAGEETCPPISTGLMRNGSTYLSGRLIGGQ